MGEEQFGSNMLTLLLEVHQESIMIRFSEEMSRPYIKVLETSSTSP